MSTCFVPPTWPHHRLFSKLESELPLKYQLDHATLTPCPKDFSFHFKENPKSSWEPIRPYTISPSSLWCESPFRPPCSLSCGCTGPAEHSRQAPAWSCLPDPHWLPPLPQGSASSRGLSWSAYLKFQPFPTRTCPIPCSLLYFSPIALIIFQHTIYFAFNPLSPLECELHKGWTCISLVL